jgi:ATP-dependent RNA helicase DDX51/DBP6
LISDTDALSLSESKFLDEKIKQTFRKSQIESLFAVQSKTVPLVLSNPHRDFVVCFPTGSGKTLAYAIPIVQSLMNRVVARLRALILVPTRELAVQVSQVFLRITKDFNLKVAVCSGHSSFIEEQKELVDSFQCEHLHGGSTAVDVLITTPGRLVDHLESTPGFTLQHLRFIVVDEADRLLGQGYNEWVSKVDAALWNAQQGGIVEDSLGFSRLDAVTYRSHGSPWNRVQKLLFSATISTNPSKLAGMKLENPIYITSSSGSSFSVPETLSEYIIQCDSDSKPMMLAQFLHSQVRFERTIVFTSSVETTTRLAGLIRLIDLGIKSVCFTASLTKSERIQSLQAFVEGHVNV